MSRELDKFCEVLKQFDVDSGEFPVPKNSLEECRHSSLDSAKVLQTEQRIHSPVHMGSTEVDKPVSRNETLSPAVKPAANHISSPPVPIGGFQNARLNRSNSGSTTVTAGIRKPRRVPYMIPVTSVPVYPTALYGTVAYINGAPPLTAPIGLPPGHAPMMNTLRPIRVKRLPSCLMSVNVMRPDKYELLTPTYESEATPPDPNGGNFEILSCLRNNANVIIAIVVVVALGIFLVILLNVLLQPPF